MNPWTGDDDIEARLETEIEAELSLAESSRPEEVIGRPAVEWLFDPEDTEHYEVGLRSLLGAVEAVEGDSPHHQRGTDDNS